MINILKKIWSIWKTVAETILEWAFRLILLVFYFTIFMPFAIVFKYTDKETFESGWHNCTLSKGEEQY
jgi:hypothetical protein